eukprot:3941181-Rhodomonas_salina.3
MEKTTVKCWQKGSFARQKLTKSSEKPRQASWNEAMRTLPARLSRCPFSSASPSAAVPPYVLSVPHTA